MISVPQQYFHAFVNGQYSYFLNVIFVGLKNLIMDGISDILPLALPVAGAVLVVFLGWRLFRNFTRG